MKKLHDKQFPNENQKYRDARNDLLKAEMKLRKQTEDVAALRRKLPTGGKLKEDYVFEEIDPKTGKVKETKLSELFGDKNTLIIYSYMYPPENERPCASCTSIIDGINGMVFNVNEKVSFVMVAKAPIKKLVKWAKSKNWKHVRMLSSYNNTYNIDYFGETESGGQMPMTNVFIKKGKNINHFWGTELLYAPTEKEQDPRHVDMISPLWNLLDITPDGRGKKWNPIHW